jgi:hypothetical protein
MKLAVYLMACRSLLPLSAPRRTVHARCFVPALALFILLLLLGGSARASLLQAGRNCDDRAREAGDWWACCTMRAKRLLDFHRERAGGHASRAMLVSVGWKPVSLL